MMKKKLFSAVVALVALVSCSENDFVGDSSLQGGGKPPISFGFDVPTVTRASGADAATKLSNQFIVYGEKSESDDGAAPAAGKLVFQNYKVAYTSNTAYTTQSNTKDWEYVGQQWTNDESSNIITSTADLQTIKYWDYSASNYVFTAVSALPEDISNGRVTITKTTSATSGNKVYDKGYTITLAKTTGTPNVYPTLSDIYISDRLVISQGSGSDRNAENAYGGNVTLTFRNLLSQVRAGVYETIPGYDIISMDFYVSDGDDADSDLDKLAGHAFGAICPNVKIGGGFEGTLNVTYYETGTAAENQPKVSVSGSSSSAADLILGTNMSTLNQTSPTLLGTTAVAPTWDTANGDYTNVLPQSVDNTTNLKLKCDYTLWNNITGETIEVKGATAVIPSQYLQWKSNFKYTYLFKISDNTNGSTGQDVTGLYPITFDAVEMVNGDGIAEYITTVSEPSITTFGAIYNTTETKYTAYQTGKNEYQAQTSPNQLDIYATIMDGSVVVCPTIGTNINVYKATTDNATTYPITEASVAESIAEVSVGAKKITVENMNADANTCFTAAPAIATAVPKEDGTTITSIKCVLTSQPSDWVASDANVYYSDAACVTKVTGEYADGTYYKKDFVLKLTGVNETTETTAYVIEYVKTANTYNTSSSTYIFPDETEFNNEVSTNGMLYTDANGTNVATWSYYNDSHTSDTYYRRTSLKTKGTYAYKVIRVQAAE